MLSVRKVSFGKVGDGFKSNTGTILCSSSNTCTTTTVVCTTAATLQHSSNVLRRPSYPTGIQVRRSVYVGAEALGARITYVLAPAMFLGVDLRFKCTREWSMYHTNKYLKVEPLQYSDSFKASTFPLPDRPPATTCCARPILELATLPFVCASYQECRIIGWYQAQQTDR